MKFGHSFLAHQVPEWQHHYMDYKKLKQIIKIIYLRQSELNADENKKLDDEQVKTALAKFFYTLDENLYKVDDYYCRKFIDYEANVNKIKGVIPTDAATINGEEIEDIISVLSEYRNYLKNLKWFGELNKRGFVKILKKLDKKTGTHEQQNYLKSKIYPMSFADETGIVKLLSEVNNLLNILSNNSSSEPNLKSLSQLSLLPPTSTFSMNKSESKKSSDAYSGPIEADDSDALENLLTENFMSPLMTPLKLLLSLLNEATLTLSYKCIDKLLEIIPVLGDTADFTSKNFIHHHVIALGKRLAHQNGANSQDISVGLFYIFEHLPTHLKFAILQKDSHRRTPLHYAALYGMAPVTSTILQFLKQWELFDDHIPLDNIEVWGDSEGLTPLHLAILGKHVKTTQVLIDSVDVKLSCSELLHITTRLDCPEILCQLLQSPNFNIDAFDKHSSNETALFIACKLNLKNIAKCLLDNGANTEIKESSFGWTPIFVAAANGHNEIIQQLIAKGAKYYLDDDSGWTPREHAALRGHMDIIEMLTPPDYNPLENLEYKSPSPARSPSITANVATKVVDTRNTYLKENESIVFVNVGTTDMRDDTPALDLNNVIFSKLHKTELDCALTLVIRANNLPDQQEVSLELPLDDNHGISSDPIKFSVVDQDPLDTVIYFDIVPAFELNAEMENKRVLGRAVARLRDLYTFVGAQKRSLFNCVKIPFLETNTMDVLGYIRFEFLCITSFQKIGKIPENRKLWNSATPPKVIGHRGNGMNQGAKRSLQLGENTVQSFITAGSLGAAYVEFDVQLTKDSVPVIYHDFIVAETGMDIPMQELTLEQFLHLSEVSDKNTKSRPQNKTHKDDSYVPSSLRSNYSFSQDAGNDIESILNEFNPSQERMKLTKTWREKEFKANTRGAFIASSFTTLEELFKKVPKMTGFNMELKYPMLDESQLDGIGQIAFEMNHFCDTILAKVYENYDDRDIVFSSFHPDICMMMTMKQPTFPVLFLTESGTNYMADIRASSLQNAIRFAKTWNLFGIVSEATPIINCPRLVKVVKASGLACFTYGGANNDPENAKLEIAAGVDAVIVDSVLAVRKGLSS